MNKPILSVNNLSVVFPGRGKGAFSKKLPPVKAVDGVSFCIDPGEVLGLVGESGCGKTTLSRAIVRLTAVKGGSVIFEDNDLTALGPRQLKKIRSRIQMVFQDPYASLNPRMTVFDTLSEPLRIHRKISRADCAGEVARLMEQVGLSAEDMGNYPHEFSGGQRQRVAIARALAVGPALIIADEPVSSLDVSIQAQIINLLSRLRETMHMAMLFISHDVSVVRHVSDRIAVMFKGRIVEIGPRDVVMNPLHPYTQALLAAVPIADPDHEYAQLPPARRSNGVTDAAEKGCPYAGRCPYWIDDCLLTIPLLEPFNEGDGHRAACIRKGDLERRQGRGYFSRPD